MHENIVLVRTNKNITFSHGNWKVLSVLCHEGIKEMGSSSLLFSRANIKIIVVKILFGAFFHGTISGSSSNVASPVRKPICAISAARACMHVYSTPKA